MRSQIEIIVLAASLACGTAGFGQGGPGKDEKPPAPPAGEKAPAKTIEQLSLEEILALALKNNPDLRVAEAKLREAEAQYNRARLQLSQKMVVLRKSIEARKMTVADAQKRYERMKELYKHEAASLEDVSGAEATVLRFKAELAELEAELPYLIGKLPQEADKEGAREAAIRHARVLQADRLDAAFEELLPRNPKVPRGTEADKLRQALDISVQFHVTSLPLMDLVERLQDAYGITFINATLNENLNPAKVIPTITLELKGVSLGTALQALEDSTPGLRLTVRDYGILVTYKSELPADAISVHDFWKSDRSKEKTKTEGSAGKSEEVTRNSPPGNVEGVVKKVEKDDLVLIDVGSDAGLAKGHTLELFRLQPKPMYLGTIRIIEVKATEAVGKLAAKPREPVKEGDQVTSQVVGK